MALIASLEKWLPLCANYLTLHLLNNSPKIDFQSKLNEFIDFEGEHYI